MTRRRLLIATLSLSLLSLPTLPTHADGDGDPLVEVVAHGKARINYAAGVVKATGYGAPPTNTQNPAQARLMALGAARADALRNLAMAVSSVQVTSTTKVKNYITESDTIETKVSAVLQNAHIVAEAIGRDGTASVTVEIPLYGKGSVATAVLAEVILAPRRAIVAAPEPRLAPPVINEPIINSPVEPFKEPRDGAKRLKPVPRVRVEPHSYNSLTVTSPSDEGPFTAVIVDCRGLGIQAVMSPKIYDTRGREVYGTLHVDIDYAIETGIVGYPRNVREALTGKRAGERPLIVRAIQAKDQYKIDVVISTEDAKRILTANERDNFLEKCRVILLCDPVR